MRFQLVLILICIASVCCMTQNDRSATCFPYRSATLSSDSMCVAVNSPHILVFVKEVFCSKCLTALDDFLASHEILGRNYLILVAKSVKKSYVNYELAVLRRMIHDVNRLRFVDLTVPEKLGIPSDLVGSPYVFIQIANTNILISYVELFSDDVNGQLTVNSNFILGAYERLSEFSTQHQLRTE